MLVPLYDLGVCVLAENHSDIHIPTTIRAQILVAQSLALQTHLKGKRLGVTLNLTGDRGVNDLWELHHQATMLDLEVADRLHKLCAALASATESRYVQNGYELSANGDRLWYDLIDENLPER